MRKFRGGGTPSYRQAVKAARKAGLKVENKAKTGLIKITADGDSITISNRQKTVTRKTAAWLRSKGAGE